jgi:hypothetical protein
VHDMTARWIALLGLLGLVGAVTLVVVFRPSYRGSTARGSLVGLWVHRGASCLRQVHPNCAATLWLRDNGRFVLVESPVTEHGTWAVIQPGLLRWDHKSGTGPRHPFTWHYTLHGDALDLYTVLVDRLYHVPFHRAGSP